MSADGGKSPWNSRPFQSDVFLLASSPGRQSVITECEPNLGEAEKKLAANGPASEPGEIGSVVYDDGNVSVTERMEPGLKSITINIGAPPGNVIKPQGNPAYSWRGNVGQRPAQSLPMQGPAQLQTSQKKNEVVIPADSELPIGPIPQPKGPPPEVSGWPKDSQFNDACEIQDINAAANLKTKYGENPCKPPPMKKDKASNKLAATDVAKLSDNSSPSSDKAQSSNPLVNTNISDDGYGPSQKPAQQLGKSTADSDISNYGTPGYQGNHIPKKPACSGGDHDVGGRYQAPTPYNPGPTPQREWAEEDRRIESSGQYQYPPPTPPPSRQYQYPPTPPLTPPGAYAGPPSQDLPPLPPEGDVYYDAPEDFYYDASSQADWCPPGYVPTSKPCNFCHSRFAPLGNNTRHTGRQIAHIHNARVQHDKQGLECREKSNENEDGKPLLMLGQESDHTIIIRQRKSHHKEGCPWQRKNHHRIQPGDVRNTSFNRLGVELQNSSNLEVQRQCGNVLHVDEQGLVLLNGHFQHFEPVAGNLEDSGNCLGREAFLGENAEDMRPSPDAALGDRIDFPMSNLNSLTCDLTLEEEFVYINKYHGAEAEEDRENTNELEPSLQNLHANPHHSAKLMSAKPDQLDVNSLDPCTELEKADPGCEAIIQGSHPADCLIPQSCSFYSLTLQRQRSNPALPLILRLGSWVKDVLLPDYSK